MWRMPRSPGATTPISGPRATRRTPRVESPGRRTSTPDGGGAAHDKQHRSSTAPDARLFLPGARMIPNTERTGGTFTTHTVESFITWIDDGWKRVIGTPNDRGF